MCLFSEKDRQIIRKGKSYDGFIHHFTRHCTGNYRVFAGQQFRASLFCAESSWYGAWTGVLLETMLHLGTLAAIFMTFQKDIRHLAFEALDMFMDLIGNANLYIHNKRTGEQLHYTRIISNIYRKFVVLLLVSMIPTAFLGYTARRLVSVSATSVLIPGAGIMVTGILLLVIDLSRVGGTKAAKDAHFSDAMWIGICQGLSVFPGLSRSGLTISAGLMSGFSRTFAVKYSYILSIPAIVGAMLMELGQFGSADMTIGLGFAYVFGMIIAGQWSACLRFVPVCVWCIRGNSATLLIIVSLQDLLP